MKKQGIHDPLARLCADIARSYLGVLSMSLKDEGIERYFFPFLMIAQSHGRITQKDLSSLTGWDKVTTLRAVDYLSDKALIRRVPNPADRREQILELTSRGKKIAPKVEKAVMRTEAIAYKGLEASEHQMLTAMLSKVVGNLQREPSHDIKLDYRKEKNDKKK